MNVNPKLKFLEQVTGYPVEQDEYEGTRDKYIVFTYEDERAALRADNKEYARTAYLMVCLFVPKGHNYFADKDKIEAALVQQGFTVESSQVWLEPSMVGTEKIRRITLSVNITESIKGGNQDG